MKTILGLDLGTNSIGWALVAQSDNESRIIKAGSRIIPMAQDQMGKFDSGQSISQTAERTGYRGVRRLRERYLLRRERLHRVLNILGFLPSHYAELIDFENGYGKIKSNAEPKIAYQQNHESGKFEFVFQSSFGEMLEVFAKHQPQLVSDGKLIPYDWVIYYLRKKGLTQKLTKEELAWVILNFNQKRGYYQLRGEEEEENPNKLVEFHSLEVKSVVADDEVNKKGEIWYSVHLENGWIYRRSSKTPLNWEGKIKEFIVTTDIEDDGSTKVDKEGNERRSFRAPDENDWTLKKKKTEQYIETSGKYVGEYIFDTLLSNPNQKIKGGLVTTIERKYFKNELKKILETQVQFHEELRDTDLYAECCEELYQVNEGHRDALTGRGFVHLFMNDIIFYQRPLKSKKSLISDCKHEKRWFTKDGIVEVTSLKCAPKSHPLYQEFRLLQFVNNLKIYKSETNEDVTDQFISSNEDWQKLYEWLDERKEIDQKGFLAYSAFKIKRNSSEYKWNYVGEKTYPLNETRATITTKLSKVGVDTAFLNSTALEELWHILYSVVDKLELPKALDKYAIRYGLNTDFVEAMSKMPPYKSDYGAYSTKALKKMLPLMRFGSHWSIDNITVDTKSRIDKIIDGEYDSKILNRVRDKAINLTTINHFSGLPVWLAEYVVYNRHSEDGELMTWKTPSDIKDYLKYVFKQHSLRNPIVEQLIAETLRVVIDIWAHFGQSKENYFDEIHIELGREMKNNAKDRDRITKQVSENENTNMRIRLLLMEFLNDSSIENVRPYSPSQMELLKLYEEGALNTTDLPEDIAKIAKQAQPSQTDINKYKLWLNQKYRSPYTGAVIPLSKLFTSAYEIEHIIPQSRYFDDSLSNKVICEAEVNKDKGNMLALEYIKKEGGKTIRIGQTAVSILQEDVYEEQVKQNFSGSRSKLRKLMMDEIPETFIQRQLNDTRYISKVVKNLLSSIVRTPEEEETVSKNLISTNGSITNTLKRDWGLNDIWNEIIAPRFERLNVMTGTSDFGSINPNTRKFLPTVPLELRKGFDKKRIDHRHHALDALVIACTTRDHINYLNNESALGKEKKEVKEKKRYDLRHKLCTKTFNEGSSSNYSWDFNKPWNTFTQDCRTELETIIVSFKNTVRVINKSVNYYEKLLVDANGKVKKTREKQTKGDNWAIRQPMHKDTVFGQVSIQGIKSLTFNNALEAYNTIVNKSLRLKIRSLVMQGYDNKQVKAYFSDLSYVWEGKDIKKIDVYYSDSNNVASRVKLDESFNAKKISSVTDSGIRSILEKHAATYENNYTLAFNPDGIDLLNANIKELNNGKEHKPIYKVRLGLAFGKKFEVGQTGNKNRKFVTSADGTNLFFGIYEDQRGNREYETPQLAEIIFRLKEAAPIFETTNENGSSFIMSLSPNDNVYIGEETSSFNELNSNKIYRFIDGSGTTANFVPNSMAVPIFNMNNAKQANVGLNYPIQNEFGVGSPQSKNQKSIDDIMIKEKCKKIVVNRIGIMKAII